MSYDILIQLPVLQHTIQKQIFKEISPHVLWILLNVENICAQHLDKGVGSMPGTFSWDIGQANFVIRHPLERSLELLYYA